MEINHSNFKNLCVLITMQGYSICGQTNKGVLVENNDLGPNMGIENVKKVCANCGCHFPNGNCRPEAENSGDASIYAEIK